MGGPVDASFGSVVVGVDGSADAATALIWALRQAQVAGLAVSAVHAWLPDEEHVWSAAGTRVIRDRALTAGTPRSSSSERPAPARCPGG